MARVKRLYRPGDSPIPGYRLVESLGRGNFGEVWKALAPGGMEVALKIINLSGREGAKEFKALQRVKHIHHANLVPVFASWLIGEDGSVIDESFSDAASSTLLGSDSSKPSHGTMMLSESRIPAPVELIVAMGLGSKSLYTRLEECHDEGQESIPRDELIGFMEGAAKGIDYLNRPIHDLGEGPVPIIHGDIKPQNILIVGDGVWVCDFGLARALQTLRKTSTGMGTFAYAAPELLGGKPARTSDQYCLAISYVELSSGDLPFSETNPLKVIEIHQRGELDLSRLASGEHEVIKRATAVDPDLRWPSCSEMVRALRRTCEGDTIPDHVGTVASFTEDRQKYLTAKAPSQPVGKTAFPSAKESIEVTSAYARPASDTDRASSVITTGGEQPPASPRRLTKILLAAFALAVCAAVAWIAWPKPTIRQMIEKRITSGEVAKAFEFAEEAKQTDYAAGYWSGYIKRLAQEKDFKRAFEIWEKAPATIPADKNAILNGLRDTWKACVEDSADNGQFAEAVKTWDEALSAMSKNDPNNKRWYDPLLYIRSRWLLKINDLELQSDVSKMSEFLDKAPFALLHGNDAKINYAEIKANDEFIAGKLKDLRENWEKRVRDLAGNNRFDEAFKNLEKTSKTWLNDKEGQDLRNEVLGLWSGRAGALAKDDKYCEAYKVIEGAAGFVNNGELKNRFDNLQSAWSGRVENLGKGGRFVEAFKVLESARGISDWVLHIYEKQKEDLQKCFEQKYDSLVEKDDFVGAFTLLRSAPKDLVGKELEKNLNGAYGKLLLHVRADIQGKKPAQHVLDDLRLIPNPQELPEQYRPLYQAILILADKERLNLEENKDELQSRIAEFTAVSQQYSPSAPWALNESERKEIGMLAEKVQVKKTQSTSSPPAESFDELMQKVAQEIELQDALPKEKRDFKTAREKWEKADKRADKTNQIQKTLVEYWLAVIELKDPKGKGIEVLEDAENLLYRQIQYLPGGKEIQLCKALGQRASESAVSGQQLDKTIKLIGDFYNKDKELANRLANLWNGRIAASVNGKIPAGDDYKRLARDWTNTFESLPVPTTDLMKAWWMECLALYGDTKVASYDPLQSYPKDHEGYGHYVQAIYYRKAMARPRWDTIAAELLRAFSASDPALDKRKVPERFSAAANLACEAAVQIRSRQEVKGLLGDPFSEKDKADLCCQLLTSLLNQDPNLDSIKDKAKINEAKIVLALSARYKTKPDNDLAAKLLDELVNHDSGKLGRGDSVRIFFAYLSDQFSANVAAAQSQERTLLNLNYAMRLCELFKDNAFINNQDAGDLYGNVFKPATDKADEIEKKLTSSSAADGDLAKLQVYYEGVADFLSGRKDCEWPEGWKERAANMYQSAAQIAEKRAASPSAKAELYYKLAKAEKESPGFSREAVVDHLKKAAAYNPNLCGAYELLSQSYLLQARSALSRQQRLERLTDSINTAAEVIELRGKNNQSIPADILITLSSACVERANCDKTNQAKDLEMAVESSNKAKKQMDNQAFNPDYPYLALGNAYEDIAWILEKDSENNYKQAIKEFDNAAEIKGIAAQALSSKGRCYYRMTVETCLYPGVERENERKEQLQNSAGNFQQALEIKANWVEAHLYLGWIAKIRHNYLEADKYITKAKNLALKANDPSRVIYVSVWARFPFYVPADYGNLTDSEKKGAEEYWGRLPKWNPAAPQNRKFSDFISPECSETQAKQLAEALGRCEELGNLPAQSRESMNPLKEAAWIKGEAWLAQKKYDKALEEYNKLLPKDLKDADSSDYELLCAYARCIKQRLQANDSVKVGESAMDAVARADRAADMAIKRDRIAFARALAGELHYCIYSNIYSDIIKRLPPEKKSDPTQSKAAVRQDPNYASLTKNLDAAIEEMKEAIALLPRRPDAANWSGLCAVWLMSDPRPAGPSAEVRLARIDEIIDFKQKNIQWVDSDTLSSAQQKKKSLVNWMTLAVDKMGEILDEAGKGQNIDAKQKIQYQKLISGWKSISATIPRDMKNPPQTDQALDDKIADVERKLNELSKGP
jgi:serine/threonine protein kinase